MATTFVPGTYRVGAARKATTYTVPVTTPVTRPTLVYRKPVVAATTATTTVSSTRAVVVHPGVTTVVPQRTVKVIAPPTVVIKPASQPEVIVAGEGVELEPGTELLDVTLLQPGEEIYPGDIVVPGEVYAPPSGAHYNIGDEVEYLSKSLKKWYRCKVVDLRDDGAIELNCKPNYWFPVARQASVIRPAAPEPPEDSAYKVGDKVEYYSRKYRKWIPATVLEVDGEGSIQLDIKLGKWIDRVQQEDKVRMAAGEPEAALMSTNVAVPEEATPELVMIGPPHEEAQIRAVLVWNAYSWPPLSEIGWGPLDCDKGGAVWRGFLEKAGATDVIELSNEQCTKQGVLGAIKKQGNQCYPNDIFVFIYTGHGTQMKDGDEGEDDGHDEAICCVSEDGKRCSSDCWLRDDDFAACLVKEVNAKQIAVLVDACHSATFADFNKPIWDNKTAFSICGCQDNQESAATGMGGVFTRAMDQASSSFHGKACSVAQMYNHVLEVAKPLQQQHPSFKTGQNISIACPTHLTPGNVVWPLSYR